MFKVSFVAKNGVIESRTFGTRQMAEGYARCVKKPTIEEVVGEAPTPTVTVCPTATEDMQRQAAKEYYMQTKGGEKYVPRAQREAMASENRAERMAEHFADARAAGQAMEDAWSDWDYIQGR